VLERFVTEWDFSFTTATLLTAMMRMTVAVKVIAFLETRTRISTRLVDGDLLPDAVAPLGWMGGGTGMDGFDLIQ
jgi:hypothetical protein